jgi:spermidine/putrescine transport system ATP-binding protein
VVMDHGVIEQVGRPQDVYNRPETRFVADFLGQSNILAGTVVAAGEPVTEVELTNGVRLRVAAQGAVAEGQAVEIVIRAHKLEVSAEAAPEDALPDGVLNRFAGVVRDSNYLGGLATYFIDSSGVELQAINPIADRMFAPGEAVSLRTAPKNCVLLDSR